MRSPSARALLPSWTRHLRAANLRPRLAGVGLVVDVEALEFNHQLYAEEVAAGLHDKKKAASRRRKHDAGPPTLL